MLCFFVGCRIILGIRCGGVLARTWHTLLNWRLNESLLSWAENPSFRSNFSLELCGQWSCLVLTRAWSKIINRLPLKPSSTRSKSSLNCSMRPSFILVHQIWNLVASWPNVGDRIFVRVSVPLCESLNFWPEILQPLWYFTCLKASIFLVIIIGTWSRTIKIIIIFKNINILLSG